MNENTHKIDATRYTIRFNPVDPYQQRAMEILSCAGRRKATLIASAICEYCKGVESVKEMFKEHYKNTLQSAIQLSEPTVQISNDWISVCITEPDGEGGEAQC